MEAFATGRSRDLSRRDALAIGAGMLVPVFGACGPVRAPRVALQGPAQSRVIPLPARIDAAPGRAMLFPVRVDGPIESGEGPALRLADGTEVASRLVWLGVRTDAASSSGWLAAEQRWVVVRPEAGVVPASAGAWHLVASLPPEATGQSIDLAGREVPVNWLADPETLRPADGRAPWAPWSPPPGAPDPDAVLLAPEWRSPLRLWHARLVTGRLGSAQATPGVWPVEGEAQILDLYADLVEARWRVGLARLWYADPEVCANLLQRLCRTVELAPGVHAPAWPNVQPALDALLEGLLDPTLTGPLLVGQVSVWLDALPDAAIWVADDAAGLVGPDPEPLSQIRAAGLSDEPMLIWTTGEGDLRVGDPAPLSAGETTDLVLPVRSGRPITRGRGFAIRAGTEPVLLAVAERVPIRPPGANCGPLVRDWTLSAWADSASGAGASTPPEFASAALLYREASGDQGVSVWSVFLECAGLAPTDDQVDEVTLWFGGRGASLAVVRVSRSGTLRHGDPPGEETPIAIADEGDRWSATVPVPPEAIEQQRVIRLGITRVDARGERTAWPRRLMPWDREPGRAAIDLVTWTGLSG